MSLAPGIIVNGDHISAQDIHAEVQYHPAPNLIDAKYEAMQALVIRSLLRQEAQKYGILCIDEDDAVDTLLEEKIKEQDVTEEECYSYYAAHKDQFLTPPLFEVSHILFMAAPQDVNAYQQAYQSASRVLEDLKKDPSQFPKAAKIHSKCPSKSNGGHLGQIEIGQTNFLFEQALLSMAAGETSSAPVATEVGYHLIYLHHRAEGRLLPYESVREKIHHTLKRQKWNSAFQRYVQTIASTAVISGFCFSKDLFNRGTAKKST